MKNTTSLSRTSECIKPRDSGDFVNITAEVPGSELKCEPMQS